MRKTLILLLVALPITAEAKGIRVRVPTKVSVPSVKTVPTPAKPVFKVPPKPVENPRTSPTYVSGAKPPPAIPSLCDGFWSCWWLHSMMNPSRPACKDGKTADGKECKR